MGKSTASCLKIIACGGSTESVDRDDLDTSNQNKGSDKRGWSFRKRPATHRVLSNTVATEVPVSENKESSEPVTVNSEAHVNSTVPEKSSGIQWIEEAPRLSTSITKGATGSTMAIKDACEDDVKHDLNPDKANVVCDSILNDVDVKPDPNLEEDDVKSDSNPDEAVVIVIQAAVRRFLAHRELLRHKNVIKLQAAVRGHLVRNHAVGTLRCVQAIVKMQALVRARRANLSADTSSVDEKGVQNSGTKSHPTYISIEKLLTNRFARQLLDTTPKTKQINVKCDPSKSDSAWKWLERWMLVSSSEAIQPEQEQGKVDNAENQVEPILPSHSESTDMKCDVKGEVTPEEKQDLINSEENSHVISLSVENPQPEKTYMTESEEKSDFQPDGIRPIEVNPVFEKPVSENEAKRTAKRLATEQADSEGRKSVFGSKRSSNPAFIAAQSKFEELTSKTNSSKPVSFSSHDSVVEDSPADTHSSAHENAQRDVDPSGYLVPHGSRVVPNGGSECGTELSVTSTLDSPDQSEAGNKETEKETKVLEDVDKEILKETKFLYVEEHAFLGTELTNSISIMPEKQDTAEKSKPANNVSASQVEQKNGSTGDTEMETISAQASPRSHITVPESQGTPSSQLSAHKKPKSDKKVSSQKRKSWSSTKKSPTSSGLDSGLRRSLENLPKDSKRRDSFGSPRSDHEERDGSGSNPLPSYMQATESARAKALANSSPRSSPDVQDKETYLKKRHSLPGAVNGRHSSPRIQRSMSQAKKQTVKGNDSQERKWQR